MSGHVFRLRCVYRAWRGAIGLATAAIVLWPSAGFACACGCAVFDVGTSTLLPSGPGGTVFFEWDFLDQTTNWSRSGSAPSTDNDDKEIRSNFFLAGGQYMFNESWGTMVEVPFAERYFRTEAEDNPGSFHHVALGDVRLMGVYSGFFPDMSTGIVFGLKLPTGDHTYRNFDPDTEIGTGSTDVLLGGYHRGNLTITGSWSYFAQLLWQHEIATQDHYRPGAELNTAAGVSYNGFRIGKIGVAPILQLLVSNRERDGGAAGDPDNTGYTRLLVSPGVGVSYNAWKLYSDVEVPVYQYVNGNQLIAPWALKVIASYNF
jgi:hypothetical protein